MALPTLITINGTYLKSNGSPEKGTVVFRSRVTSYHTASQSILAPTEKVVELDAGGNFSIQVPASNDPAWTPTGWTYKVSVNLGESVTTFNAVVPYNAPGATIAMSALAPSPVSAGSGPSSDLANYIPKSIVVAKGDILVGTASGTVSRLGAGSNGQVLKANSATNSGLEWGAGGSGGGGAVDSVNGQTGEVTLTKSDLGLANVDNTSDANKPLSSAATTALAGKEPTISAGTTSQYWRGDKSWQTLNKSAVGLSNVDNTADTAKPISTATQAALDGKSATSHTHDSLYVRSDIATVKGDLLVASASGTFVKIPVGTDGQVLKANSAATNGVEWGTDLTASGGSGGAVTSVNGQTGDVTLTKASVGLANVDNTSDANKPVSSATQIALNGKQDVDSDLTAIAALSPVNDDIIQRKSGVWTNRTVAQFKSDLVLTKSDVGLANVDNTADTAKPVSTAQQTALNLKANLASPTFTGTVSGISKSMVGLGSVDNVQQQPLDSDLTAIAALTPADNDIIQRKSSAWVNRTVAQFKSDLSLVKADVGLGNVDNVQQQPLDSDLTAIAAIAPANDDVIQRKAGVWVNRTMAQFKSDLALVKGDVGLGNVDNTSDAAKPVSTATQSALDGKQPLATRLTNLVNLTIADDSILQQKSGAIAARTPAQFKTDLALTKSDVGLANVDNTADTAKPISTATQSALDGKANTSHGHSISDVSLLSSSLSIRPVLKVWNGASYDNVANGSIYVGGTTDPTNTNGDVWIDTSSATDFSVTGNLTVAGNLTVNGIGAKVSKVRTTNATARSSATLAADDVLTATLGLGTWVIRTVAIYLGSGTTGDFQMAYTVPTGSAYNRISNGIIASSTATGATDKGINHQAGVAVGTGMVFATTTTADFAEETLIYNVTTAGTFAVTWARSSTSETATLLAGSYFIAERIA